MVIAPGVSDGGRAHVFAAQDRTCACSRSPPATGANALDLKRVGGGLLVQTPDDSNVARGDAQGRHQARARRAASSTDLLFAWRVAKFVKSNAIVFCGDGMTLGVGAGQMSRVDSARIAAIKAQDAGLVARRARWPPPTRSSRSATASTSSRRRARSAVIQPGGSVRDDEVIAAADEHGMAMVFTGVRHFRH